MEGPISFWGSKNRKHEHNDDDDDDDEELLKNNPSTLISTRCFSPVCLHFHKTPIRRTSGPRMSSFQQRKIPSSIPRNCETFCCTFPQWCSKSTSSVMLHRIKCLRNLPSFRGWQFVNFIVSQSNTQHLPEVTLDTHEKYREVYSVCLSVYESTMSHTTRISCIAIKSLLQQ
jgi:hypothetical protein